MGEERTMNLTEMINESYHRIIGASEYAALLARHADALDGTLPDDPPTRFLFALSSENPDIPRLAREQLPAEICRYALLFMMAHWERYLFELNALRRIAHRANEPGRITGEDFQRIVAESRSVARHRSLDGQLADLEQLHDESVAAGTRWFRGLCAVRRCITHRAAIVEPEDQDLLEGIAWRRLVLLRDDEPIPDDERSPKVDAGQTVGYQFDDRVKRWAIGDRVVFDPLEMQEIAFTLVAFAGILHDALHSEFVELLGK